MPSLSSSNLCKSKHRQWAREREKDRRINGGGESEGLDIEINKYLRGRERADTKKR